jgi:ribosome-binding protein aMBF1 (putative translation factor)
MKTKLKKVKPNLCWCGHRVEDHPRYLEYTGYICTVCDRCNDFGTTVNE